MTRMTRIPSVIRMNPSPPVNRSSRNPPLAALAALVALLLLSAAPRASAEPPAPAGRDEKIAELQRQIAALAGEVEKLKLGAAAEPSYETFGAMGPAASKVYAGGGGLSIGGYGELTYENYRGADKRDFADALRFILYGGYKFSDRLIMNTELEFEHAGIGNVGGRAPEVYVEFSYLDFLISERLNVRTGLLLMPVGIVNEFHEPTVYNGVNRPDLERMVIPSTWRELGIMLHGKSGRLAYDAALVTGPRADRFTKGSWIRDGRQQGAQVNADEFGGVLRLRYALNDALTLGGSYYRADAGSGRGRDAKPAAPPAIDLEGRVTLREMHALYRKNDLSLKALAVRGEIDGNGALRATAVGSKARGWYAECAYDLRVGRFGEERGVLTPFYRHEEYDTHAGVFAGVRDPAQERTVRTLGVGYKPHPNVVLKADYQWRDTASALPAGKGAGLDENKIDQFNLGAGFIF